MRISHWCRTLVCSVALASCATASFEPAQFTVEVSDAQDRVVYDMEGRTAIFRITSPSGMGSAQVALASGTFPERLVLRFYLKGLEQMVFAYDTTTISASVSSSDEHMVLESVLSESGAQDEIGPDSPHWMDIRFVPDGKQASAEDSQAGYFEVVAPNDFMARRYPAFSIRWLDFYR